MVSKVCVPTPNHLRVRLLLTQARSADQVPTMFCVTEQCSDCHLHGDLLVRIVANELQVLILEILNVCRV